MHIGTFKIFCDLAESGSFSKAAIVNGVTQSAVSQQIRGLEKQFQVQLIERSRRMFALTPAGAAFLVASRGIMEIYDNLGAGFHQVRDVIEGGLKVAAIYSIGLHELPPLLKVFREKYPQVNVQVEYRRSQQVYTQVMDGEVDLGLVAYPVKRTGLRIEVFNQDELVVIVHPSHPFARAKVVSLNALVGERFIAFEPDQPTRKVIDRHLRGRNITITHEAEFDNIETVKRAVEVESGVSIVPRNTVRQEVKNGNLAVVDIEGTKLVRPLGVIMKGNRQRSPAAREFVEILRKGGA